MGLGAKPERRRCEDRGAAGAETETPKSLRGRGMGRGFPSSQLTSEYGERRKLPQRGPRRSPGRKRFLANVNSCSRSLYVVVRPSVCRLSVVCRLSSVVCLSVTFVHPTQPIEIFGNFPAPRNTLVTWRHPGKILRRSSQGNPPSGG